MGGQESEKKVARAKEDREAQRSKLAEKDGKAAKVLKLTLHTKVSSLKSVTEKHTKEALTKMERHAESAAKDLKNWKSQLVTDAIKKAAEQTQIIADSKTELQAARDALMEATSDEKKKMARMKVHELTTKMEEKKAAQQSIINENVEVKLMMEHAVKYEQKQG